MRSLVGRKGSANRVVGLWFSIVLLAALSPVPVLAHPVSRSILVLEESDAVRGPFYATVFSALRAGVIAEGPPVSIYIENLDLSFFAGQRYEETLQLLLREKYRDRPIGVIVAVGLGALQRAIEWRPALWPDAPIVFCVVDEFGVKAIDLPANVTGKTIRLRLEDMVAAARAVVPHLEHVAIVGDRFDTLPAIAFRHFADEMKDLGPQLEVTDLTGLPMAELKTRVASLPSRTAILYTPVYSDGAGTFFPPADAVAMLAEVANRPIISPLETYIGRGAVGGYAVVPSIIGAETAQQVLSIFDGHDASSIPVTLGNSLRPIFDWSVMQRWGVDESDLPAGSEIRNRILPIWRQYPRETAITAAVLLLQSGFIAALLYEHRRRRKAEMFARARMSELAHVSRQATVGELSASIAHELNQPLGAVQLNAEAAEQILTSPTPDLNLIKDILGDIRSSNQQASEIIVSMRRLLKKSQAEMRVVDATDVVGEAFKFAAMQAAANGVELVWRPTSVPLPVRADPIQLQQVVMNLIANGIEAVSGRSGERRVTGDTARASDTAAEIWISDTGPGLSREELKRVFEPFYSTKEEGMGMGLSIARTIVEMHGGSIWVENRQTGGAVFRILLPLAAFSSSGPESSSPMSS